MQEYLSRTHLGEKLDRIGGTLMIVLASVMLFALLWGMRLTSFLAGTALGAMLLILRERTREKRLHHKEKALRRRIGGELKMEEWLLMPVEKAHAQAALVLSTVYPLEIERVTASGVVCTNEKNGEKVLVCCAQLHRQEVFSARDAAAFQRACLQEKAQRVVVCGVGKCSDAARQQAQTEPAIVHLSYERMIALTGRLWPATDAQLIKLGTRKQRRKWSKALLHSMLCRERANKYLLYGLLLCFLYVLVGLRGYLIPGCICLVLMALCRTGMFVHDEQLLM